MKRKSNIIFKFLIVAVFMLASLLIGLSAVFTNEKKELIAVNAEAVAVTTSNAQITNNGWTESSGKYSFWVMGGGSSSTVTLNIKIVGKHNFSFTYKNTMGTFSVSCNGVNCVSSSGNTNSDTTKSVALENEGENIIIFTATSTKSSGLAALAGFKADSAISNLKIEVISTDFASGNGSVDNPYLIETEEQLKKVSNFPGSAFKLANDIELTESFTPIGTSLTPFTGTFDGNGKKITGLQISGGSYQGFFGYTNGATISNLTIENAEVSATTKSGVLIGYASGSTKVTNVTLINCNITSTVSSNTASECGILIGYSTGSVSVSSVTITNCVIQATGAKVGGFVGYSNGKSGITVSNSSITGKIYSSSIYGNVGGFSGSGGTFSWCTMGASVYGIKITGGFTGGYNASKFQTNSSFSNCFVTGEIKQIGESKNNYPYVGIINGYGAWESYDISNSGQKITINYTTTIGVDSIKLFNANTSPSGIDFDVTNTNPGTYSVSKDVTLTGTYALAMSDYGTSEEARPTGITGNYGGFVIQFRMKDGSYKYLSTLDRTNFTFKSSFDIDLNNLTSYVDNFGSITIDQTLGSGDYKTEDWDSKKVSIFGAAVIDNANDFEHLSWRINGGIPTTFAGGEFYNIRSVATISICFDATSENKNVDLTEIRYANKTLIDGVYIAELISEDEYDSSNSDHFILNTGENGEVLHQFYGFGKSEMHPYRGCIYGNYYTLKVNMDFPDAYLMGIIASLTNETGVITIEKLTISGIINGRYRVGLIGELDGYERTTGVNFSDIVIAEGTTITAMSQVAGLLGEAQGSDSVITATNCVNYATITATKGSAGGLFGNLSFLTSEVVLLTLENCKNYGSVRAFDTGEEINVFGNVVIPVGHPDDQIVQTYSASGFVISCGTITLKGENINGGLLASSVNKVNSFAYTKTSYSPATGNKFVEFKLSFGFGAKDLTFIINGLSYTADSNGVVILKLPDIENTAKYEFKVLGDYINEELKYTVGSSYAVTGSMVVPVNVVLGAVKNETTSSKDSWSATVKVTLSNSDDEIVVPALINITDEELKTNKLVFKNVTFSPDTAYSLYSTYKYKIPTTLTSNFSRITTGVEDYVNKAENLIEAKTGSNFLSLGQLSKKAYTDLAQELKGYDSTNNSDNITRFNNFISNSITNNQNLNVSNDVMKDYYAVIVESADLSSLENITVTYQEIIANSNIEKTISFAMLDGSINNAQITYTFVKNSSKIKTNNVNSLVYTVSTTDGVSFKTEGNQVTYTFNSDIDITITKQELGVNFTNVSDAIFDGTNKTITHELTQVLPNDNVLASLLYNGSSNAINAKTYEVTLNSDLTGDDSAYYVVPSEYTKGSLKINPLTVEVSLTSGLVFTFDNTTKTPTFEIIKDDSNIYEIKNSDYSVTYNVDSLDAPVNAGSHTLNIILTDNLVFDGNSKQETISFVINKAKITGISIQTEYVYSKSEPTFIYTNFEGLLNSENIVVSDYTIYKNYNEATDFNVGAYKLQIKQISADNYELNDEIEVDFSIIKREVQISYVELTSVYGENTNNVLNNAVFTDVGTDKICAGDSLGVRLNPLTSLTVGTKTDLSVTWTNKNYDVDLVETSYEITKKEVEINYVENNFTYNGENQLNKIISPEIDIVQGDEDKFRFKLSDNKTEFKHFGEYTLEFIQNDYVAANYTISSELTCKYNIKKFDVNITVNDLTKTYNEDIEQNDFSTNEINLFDDLSLVAELTYIVDESAEFGVLDVGEYDIDISFTAKDLYDNYNFIVKTGKLHIIKRNTKLVSQNIEKKYDMSPVSLVAKLYGVDNEEILNANITYTYYKNESSTPEENSYALEVGSYKVHVESVADENNDACEADFYITIKQTEVIINVENLSVTYNGKEYVPSFTAITENNIDVKNLVTYTLKQGDENKTSIKDASNDYSVVFSISDSNLCIKEQQQKQIVVINPIDLTVKLVDRTVIYKGEYKVQDSEFEIVSGSVLKDESLNVTFIVKNYSENAGEYVLTLENTNKNYNVSVIEGIFTIDKRELSLNYSGESSLIYGYEKDVESELLKVVIPESDLKDNDTDVYSIYYTNEKGNLTTDVIKHGTYYLCVKLIDDKNYKFEDSDEKLVSKEIFIAKQTHELTIVLNSKVYDGFNIGQSVISSNLSNFEDSLYKIEYYLGDNLLSKTPIDVGDYKIKIVPKDESNYLFKNNESNFSITKKEVTIKPIDETYCYNKLTIKPNLVLEGLVDPNNVYLETEYISDNGEFIIVDDYQIHVLGLSGSKAGNYNLKSEEYINYSIVPTIVDIESYISEHTFTNVQLTNSQLEIKFNNSLVYLTDYTVSELPIVVNDYLIDITINNSGLAFSKQGDKYVYVKSVPLKINQAEITGVEFNDAEVNYDGLSHSLSVPNLKLSNGVILEVSYSENSFKNVGDYKVFATLTNENYKTLVLDATLSIKQAKINVNVLGENSFVYSKLGQGKTLDLTGDLWFENFIYYNYEGEDYNGNDYSSTEKPVVVGSYKLVIYAKEPNNILVNNNVHEFKITKKPIEVKNLVNQEYIYSKTEKPYVFDFVGNIKDDDVSVLTLYDGVEEEPINVKINKDLSLGAYEVTFKGLSGLDSFNYYLVEPQEKPTLKILPKEVNVIAHNKSVIYGDDEVELTCDFGELCAGDNYIGAVEREKGNNVNSYKIMIGSLSAGANYIINFKEAIYSIEQKPVTIETFNKSLTYNGSSQIPEVKLKGVLPKDGDILFVMTEGDTVNVGEYKLKVVLTNYNYRLESSNVYTISINKKDVSEKIISLLSNEKDYDGQEVSLIAIIDGGFDYVTSVSVGGENVTRIIDAGEYDVKVDLIDNNYKGSRTFKYIVNKISYDESVIKDVSLNTSSTSIIVSNIENISVSVDEKNFNLGNTISNLSENTTYSVYIKVHATANYNETVFDVGKLTTSKCALKINNKVEDILVNDIQSSEISKIKEILLDCESLSNIEKNILNSDQIELLKEKYQEYVESVNNDVEKIKVVSTLVDHDNEKTIKAISFSASIVVMGACVLFIKGKKRHEIQD